MQMFQSQIVIHNQPIRENWKGQTHWKPIKMAHVSFTNALNKKTNRNN